MICQSNNNRFDIFKTLLFNPQNHIITLETQVENFPKYKKRTLEDKLNTYTTPGHLQIKGMINSACWIQHCNKSKSKLYLVQKQIQLQSWTWSLFVFNELR